MMDEGGAATGATSSGRRVPAWATEYLRDALDAHERLMQVARLSITGLGMHRGRPKALKALIGVYGTSDETKELQTRAQLEEAERDAKFAQEQADAGYPVLTGMMTIALWSWLEHLVKGFVALWLFKRPATLRLPAVQKLKVRLGDYASLTRKEQAHYIVELLEQDLASPLKQGANRFTSLLDSVGLSVRLDKEVGDQLFELQKVRNCLAHRNGVVDRSLRAACPWLKLKLNEHIKISVPTMQGYSHATAMFLIELIYRVSDEYGVDARGVAKREPGEPESAATISSGS